MRIRAARLTTLIAAASMTLLLLPMPALAHSVSPACGTADDRTWSGSDECFFKIGGSPVVVQVETSTPDGSEARVRIEVVTEEEDVGAETLLMECEASGPGAASCTDQLGPDEQARVPGNLGLNVVCRVKGVGEGTYWCQSGLGF